MSTEQKSSKSLSPEAIAQLVEGHRAFLAFLERRVESRAAAEDILQSAFARGLEHGAGVQDEKVVAWFYRVLRNAVIDHYRHRSASANAMGVWGRDFTESQEPEAELLQEICQCVSGLLTTLKPEYRDALRIVDLEDGKLSELAQQSNITAENAAVRVHRARKALRRSGGTGMRELCRARLSGLPLPASRKLALRADPQGSLNSYRLKPVNRQLRGVRWNT